MSTVDHLELIQAARAERDAAIALAVDADRDGWDRKVIDQAIEAFAGTGRPFSANHIRDVLPEVRRPLIGARFFAASVRGLIREVGRVASTQRSTHAHKIALWQSTAAIQAAEISAAARTLALAPRRASRTDPLEPSLWDDLDEVSDREHGSPPQLLQETS